MSRDFQTPIVLRRSPRGSDGTLRVRRSHSRIAGSKSSIEAAWLAASSSPACRVTRNRSPLLLRASLRASSARSCSIPWFPTPSRSSRARCRRCASGWSPSFRLCTATDWTTMRWGGCSRPRVSRGAPYSCTAACFRWASERSWGWPRHSTCASAIRWQWQPSPCAIRQCPSSSRISAPACSVRP